MRFFLDANLPTLLINILKEKFGVHTTRIKDPLTDEEVFRLIKKKRSVLLTLDTDFLNILRYPPQEHFGIVVFRLKKQSMKHVAAAVLNFFETRETHVALKNLKGKNIVCREDRYKIYS